MLRILHSSNSYLPINYEREIDKTNKGYQMAFRFLGVEPIKPEFELKKIISNPNEILENYEELVQFNAELFRYLSLDENRCVYDTNMKFKIRKTLSDIKNKILFIK
jgi:hypothetical protein